MASRLTSLADYILCLSRSLEYTRHADDRPLYQSYLADAGVLLALLLRESRHPEIQSQIELHERRWGQTWLVGPEHTAVADAWRRFKRSL
jgi:hypothetical protein